MFIVSGEAPAPIPAPGSPTVMERIERASACCSNRQDTVGISPGALAFFATENALYKGFNLEGISIRH
jgi:hypothetical protein